MFSITYSGLSPTTVKEKLKKEWPLEMDYLNG
jgi:hypothetical protein